MQHILRIGWQQSAMLLTAAMMLLTVGCSSETGNKGRKLAESEVEQTSTGDSTIYGLACEGCSDTMLVVLSNLEGAPDTLSILNATQMRRIYGHPRTGDELAIMLNSEDSTVADIVINLEQLKQTWCYEVTPTLRRRAGFSEEQRQRFLTLMPDSVKQRLMQPREYGLQISGNHAVRAIGMQPSDRNDNSPVEYPKMKRYRQWHIWNGRLILSTTARDTTGRQQVAESDTATFVKMRRDTLELRFSDGHQQQYYRKRAEAEDEGKP
jgi:hypothetical protein